MFRTLRGDAPDSLTDLPPAGSRAPGVLGRCLAQALSRASKLIGEPECGQRHSRLAGHTAHGILSAPFGTEVGHRLEIWWHSTSVPAPNWCFNYVLTTMC